MSAYGPLAAHGIWPADGGLLDQAGAFVAGVAVADAEKSVVENERLERNRAGKRQRPAMPNRPTPATLLPEGASSSESDAARPVARIENGRRHVEAGVRSIDARRA